MTTKFGLIGTGIMGKIYGGLLKQMPGAELVALVGNSEEKTAALGKELGIPAYSGGKYSLMLEKHPDIDAVIVATPEKIRLEPVRAVLEAGKHLILEKPFTDTWPMAKELGSMLERFDRYFAVCHVLRYSPRFSALKTAVADGKIGDVRHIYARRNSNTKRVQRVLGHTDLAFWLTPHDLDIMRWITGSEVKEVFATGRNQATTGDDYLSANLRFENGVGATLEILWCNPPLSGKVKDALFEVRGTRGAVELLDSEMNVDVYQADDKVLPQDTYEEFEIQGLKGGYFKNMLEGQIHDIQSGAKFDRARLSDGMETIRACAMIRKSLDEKRVVTRSEFQ